jgi:pectate lyase
MSVGPELDRGGFGTFERGIELTRLLDPWKTNHLRAADDVGADGKLAKAGPPVKEAGGGYNAGETLFSDDFSGGFAGWTVVDEGNYSAPSNWSVVSGELRQTSNINGEGGSSYAKPGTYAVRGEAGWTNYTVAARLKTTNDNDAIGVMFGYQNASNYYRFSMDHEQSYRWLVKVVNGTWTLLASDAVAYALEQWHDVEATLAGGVVTVKVNGQPVFSVNDTSHTAGKIALYSWANAGARFDDVVVTGVGGAPPCTYAINPTSASVVAAGGSGSLSVTAGGRV